MIKKLYILLAFLIPLVEYAQVNYETEIQPLFDSNCISCHSGGSPFGGLNLTDLNNLLEGSNNGPVIVEGSPNSSLLWQEVFAGSMPPGPNDLSEEQVNLIEQWILEYSNFQINDCLEFNDIQAAGSSSNTIGLPFNMTTDIEIGDQIGLFFIDESGTYVPSDVITWNSENNSLTGWGDDNMTQEIEGFTFGEEFNFFVLKEDGSIYSLIVEMSPSSFYVPNGIEIISSLLISDLYASGCNENTTDVFGCMDSSACNYNENATDDDGSCLILDGICELCSGETDGTGTVIDNDIDNDGICDSDEILGCTDSSAINFNENATDDDGSCLFEIFGCIDATACNYNELANTDDNSCTYPEFGYDCFNECVYPDPNNPDNCFSDYEPITITNLIWDLNSSQVTVVWAGGLSIPTIEISLLANYGSPSAIAYNIDFNLENNGSYTFEIPCAIILDANNDGILDENVLLEYAISIEQNFNNSTLAPCNVVTNDYSFWGNNLEGIGCNDCSNNIVTCSQTNFYSNSNTDLNQLAQVDLSICTVTGCTDSNACNYDEDANTDDGSCNYVDGTCETCENGIIIDNDTDNDGICNDDEIIQVNGCTDDDAFNFDSEATIDDDSCCFVNGCSQPDNILYNPDACFFDDQLCVTIVDCDDTIIPFTTINNVSCFNDDNGSIEVIFNSVFGGTPPYTVIWEQLIDTDGDGIDDSQTLIFDSNNDGLLENLEASNYQVTLVDDLGCSGTSIVSVSQPAEININFDTTEILCNGDESNISLGIEGNIMNYDVLINGNYIETVNAGTPTITNENDFEFTQTGSNNTIIIFGCDDSNCSDANGIITPGDIIGIFYENVNGDLECGGSALFNGTIPFAALSGWQTEFALDNGFEDGDSYIWYLFDSSGDIYQLNPNYDLDQGVDYFTPGGFTVITNFEVGTILGSNDDFYFSTQSGEYVVELLAENGCVSSTTILIDQPSPIELISSEVSNPTCNGSIDGSIDIEISGGSGSYSFEWIGPLGDVISTNEDLSDLSSGNYTFTVTDENNCVFSNSFEINNPETIEVSYSYEPISCNGENTSLQIEVNGGVPPYTIDYNGQDPNNISSGFYTFSLTDDLGCLETFDVSISDPDGIAINYPAVETVCYGETDIPVDFTMSISGGIAPYSYEWFDNNGLSLGIFSSSATVPPGDYSIVITDSDNCSSVPSFLQYQNQNKQMSILI